MLHANEMMAKCDIQREPGHKTVTESHSPALVFKHRGTTWDILWQKSKHRKVLQYRSLNGKRKHHFYRIPKGHFALSPVVFATPSSS